MDHYLPLFQQHGASLVTLAKGNRSKEVTESCKKSGGFYLGSIGGVAARLGKECITKMEVLEYPELEMEAIYMITVKDFPAFIIVDDKGNDFYAPFV
jgi:fumarate hydratase class I